MKFKILGYLFLAIAIFLILLFILGLNSFLYSGLGIIKFLIGNSSVNEFGYSVSYFFANIIMLLLIIFFFKSGKRLIKIINS